MKFLFLVLGMGEYAQAETVAKKAQANGIECFFGISKNLESIVAAEKFSFELVENDADTQKLIQKVRPDVLFLCNSKTVRDAIRQKPEPKPYIVTLDSNWLFGQEQRWQVFPWIDKIFVVFPQKIFDAALKENGGVYEIPFENFKKISCPGFVPTGEKIAEKRKAEIRRKFGLEKGEKLVFAYFGKGPTFRDFLLPKFIQAIESLHAVGKGIRVFWTGPKTGLEKDFFIEQYNLTSQEFVEVLGSADLVVQHHGLGTLAKVIHNEVPAICFIPEKYDVKPKEFVHSPSYEIEAFEKNGVCKSLLYAASPEELANAIDSLLYDKNISETMKEAQKEIFEAGEGNVINEILRAIKK